MVAGERGYNDLPGTDRYLGDRLPTGRDDWVRKRQYVVLKRNTRQMRDDRMEAERFLTRANHSPSALQTELSDAYLDSIHHKCHGVEVLDSELATAAFRHSSPGFADFLTKTSLILRVASKLVKEESERRRGGLVSSDRKGKHLGHEFFVVQARLRVCRRICPNCRVVASAELESHHDRCKAERRTEHAHYILLATLLLCITVHLFLPQYLFAVLRVQASYVAEVREGLCRNEAEQLEDGLWEVVPCCAEQLRSLRSPVLGYDADKWLVSRV